MSKEFLPNKLKQLRKSHNYTQDYVASAIGTVRQTYSNYEAGKRSPSVQAIYKLASLYKISVDELMTLSAPVDVEEFYDIPVRNTNAGTLNAYLEFVNDPVNRTKYKYLSTEEKKLLFGYDMLDEDDKEEFLEILKIKQKKYNF